MTTITDLQRRVWQWMRTCFRSEDAFTIEQRGFRMLEEANELAQSCAVSREDAHRLVDYVYDRPAGIIEQEIGGLGVTLLAVAEASNLTAQVAIERELQRCIENTEKIREKDLAKPKRSPLPGGGSVPPTITISQKMAVEDPEAAAKFIAEHVRRMNGATGRFVVDVATLR